MLRIICLVTGITAENKCFFKYYCLIMALTFVRYFLAVSVFLFGLLLTWISQKVEEKVGI